MIKHQFLEHNMNKLYTICHIPDFAKKNAFLLLQGLGENISDLDYFMKNTAYDLYKNNFFVMQVDLIGHGESDGDFVDIETKIIIEEVNCCTNFMKDCGYEKVNIITRGYMVNLIGMSIHNKNINTILGISPVKLIKQDVEILKNAVSTDSINYLLLDLFQERETLDKFITMLGSEPRNLYTECIHGTFYNDIISGIAMDVKMMLKSIFITYDIKKEQFVRIDRFEDINENSLSYYEGYGLQRNIQMQCELRLKLISIICSEYD